MARPPLSSNWEALGTTAFYRREDVYTLLWSLPPLSAFHWASARCGGPIALMLDTSKPIVSTSRQAAPAKHIQVYSSSGILIMSVPVDPASKVVAFGFDHTENLVLVYQDGFYRVHPLEKESSSSSTAAAVGATPTYAQHSLGSEASETGVLDAKIHESGMVILTGSLAFFEVHWQASANGSQLEASTSPHRTHISKLAEPNLQEAPDVWTVVSPEVSLSRRTEVLIPQRNSLVLVDIVDAQDQHLNDGPFLFVEPSPNGRFVALVSHNRLIVANADYSRNLSEYDLSAEGDGEQPSQVAWCGSNTVMLFYPSTQELVMVGPFGDVLRYNYATEHVRIISEIDGARVISQDRCEYIHRVADSTLAIFRPGSASPAAILFEASEQYDQKSPKADENLRSIRADLASAVDVCIDAAGREWDAYWQRRLLKAASYGKAFLDLYSPVDFVKMTQTLRVLNAVRYYEIGIPLTYDQYRQFAPDQLIARLTARSHHLLSLRMASYLHISQAPVLKHWAASKIKSATGSDDDKEATDLIVNRLKGQSEVSCADVALTAWEAGQNQLASRLLEFEPKASKQVPLLLKMREDAKALSKACSASDPDLIYAVLLHLRRAHGPAQFFRYIDNKPEAIALFQIWAREHATELLRDFNYQDDRRTDSALLVMSEAYAIKDQKARTNKLREAQKFFSEDSERTSEAKALDEQLRLAAIQQQLQNDSEGRRPFMGLSVNETLRQCIVAGWVKKADSLRNDFKVPDKRYWMVKLKALTELRDWPALEAFAKSKRSPIGYEPFVRHLVSQGYLKQAAMYVPRCESRNRVEMWVLAGDWAKAGEDCKDRGDRNKLIELRERSPNNVIAAQLEQLLEATTAGF